MDLALLLVAVAVLGGACAVALGRVRGGLEAPTSSLPLQILPVGALAPQDVDDVVFALGLRGYRMDQVDAVLERLRTELERRDAELAALRAGTAVAQDPPDDVGLDHGGPGDSAPDSAPDDVAVDDLGPVGEPAPAPGRHRGAHAAPPGDASPEAAPEAAPDDPWRPRAGEG